MGSAGPGTEVVDGLGAFASAASPVRRDKGIHRSAWL